MSRRWSPPLVLLSSVVIGWVLLRGSVLASFAAIDATPLPEPVDPGDRFSPDWTSPLALPTDPLAMAPIVPVPGAMQPPRSLVAAAPLSPVPLRRHAARPPLTPSWEVKPAARVDLVPAANALLLARMLSPLRRPQTGRTALSMPWASPLSPAHFPPARAPVGDAAATGSRWSGSAWLLLRDQRAILPLGGSTLAGSQAGLRVDWTPQRGPLAAYARAVSSGRLGEGAEGAVGLALRPAVRVPLTLNVERRVRLAGPARNAFAAYVQGGVSRVALGEGWHADGYGAAGIVGTRHRDLFVEGEFRIDRALAEAGRLRLRGGGGLWGAAQPGAARVDIGPTVAADIGDVPAQPRLAIDWRQRIAGDAAPTSGPALTLSVAF